MNTPELITIPIAADLAHAYSNASSEEKIKIQAQVEHLLREMLPTTSQTLQSVVHELSQKAADRGMTPEILEELLNENE